MSKSNSTTKTYTVQVEDQIVRFAQVLVMANSAAEAALIARRQAHQGKVAMAYREHHIAPTIYSIDGGNLPFVRGSSGECLCDDIGKLLEQEGLPPEMADEFDEYQDDTAETGYEGR